MPILKLVCINCFHTYFNWSHAYWVTMVLSNYPLEIVHYNSLLVTILLMPKFLTLHPPFSILINLFKSIKFLLFINIGFFGCRHNKNTSMTITH